MIERVDIANFKAIGPRGVVDRAGEPADLRLAPLTIFVGPNGSGKSSILEGIALLAQSARPLTSSGLVTEGRLVALGDDVTALYHDRRTDQELRLELTWRPPAASPIGCWLGVREAQDFLRREWRQGLRSGDSRIEFLREAVGQGGYRLIARMTGDPSADVQVAASLERFLDEQLFVFQAPSPTPEASASLASWKAAADSLAQFFSSKRLRYLSALRGGRLMEQEQRGEAATAGLHGLNTLRLLSLIKTTGHREKRGRLERLAGLFGMPDLTAGYAAEQTLRAEFEADAATHTRLPVFHAGFGSQYALPVIADLVDADPGTTILVEEIEHSSHPEWLHQWGLTLAEATSDWGLQVVTTTHAPALVLSVALAVRKGRLGPDQVAIYEFAREGDLVTADRLEFDDAGRLERGWISSFARAESKLLDDLLADDEGEEPARPSA